MSFANHQLIDSFTATIAARLGLRLDQRIAAEIIERRAGARAVSIARYLLEFDEPGELRELAAELTVGETYFFRHTEQLDAFVEVALPARLAARARAGAHELRVLSAGCSSGEEPYTLAMLLHERVPSDWRVELQGVDINARALARAAAGRYSRWSMRAMPPAIEHQWFEPARDGVVLSSALRARVQFTELNLTSNVLLWQRSWDTVFCRNVLMYFTEDQAEALLARIADSLAPGGYLFLGHAEIMWSRGAGQRRAQGALADLETCNSNGTYYYRKRTEAAPQLAGASGLLSLDWMSPRPERAAAVRHAATVTRDQPGRLDAALDALASSGSDEQEIQLQRALMQLAQTGGGR